MLPHWPQLSVMVLVWWPGSGGHTSWGRSLEGHSVGLETLMNIFFGRVVMTLVGSSRLGGGRLVVL